MTICCVVAIHYSLPFSTCHKSYESQWILFTRFFPFAILFPHYWSPLTASHSPFCHSPFCHSLSSLVHPVLTAFSTIYRLPLPFIPSFLHSFSQSLVIHKPAASYQLSLATIHSFSLVNAPFISPHVTTSFPSFFFPFLPVMAIWCSLSARFLACNDCARHLRLVSRTVKKILV